MKYSFLLFLVLFSKCLIAQNLKLNNAVIIAQFEKEEDRYAMQAMLSELFKANQVKVLPVMNVLKQGEDIQHLLNDSIQAVVHQKGFDTYLVVNVRGYDRKFKVSEDTQTLAEMLETTSIYHIYRDEATRCQSWLRSSAMSRNASHLYWPTYPSAPGHSCSGAHHSVPSSSYHARYPMESSTSVEASLTCRKWFSVACRLCVWNPRRTGGFSPGSR